jgi:hypothetical protein
MAAPERVAFDRYPEVRTPPKAVICADFHQQFKRMTTSVLRGDEIRRRTLTSFAKLSIIDGTVNIVVRYSHDLTRS